MKTSALADLVRSKREALNMSQATLALACQVSERTIIRVENGTRPAPETLMALCSVLGLSPEAARAAAPQASPEANDGPSVVLPNPFGPISSRLRDASVRSAADANPRATVVFAQDAFALAETHRRVGHFGNHSTPRSEDDLVRLEQAFEPIMGKALNACCRFLPVLATSTFAFFAFLFLLLGSLLAMSSWATIWIAELSIGSNEATSSLLSFVAALVAFVILGFIAWPYNKTHDHDIAILGIRRAARRAIAISDNVITVADRSSIERIDVNQVEEARMEREDGHLKLTVLCPHEIRAKVFEFLPNDPTVEAALRRFCAGAGPMTSGFAKAG